MTFNTPTLLWSQTPESIDISIRLPNIESESVLCENNHFYFSCSSQSKNYQIEFDLDKAVEKVYYNKYDNRIAIVLEKADYEKWEFLTKVRGIYKNNIKIDWDKWADSDAEEEDEQPQAPGGDLGSPQAPSSGFGGMDMNMMRQMQQMMGGGGMDMNMMQQMMGGMNMGGEDGEEEDAEDAEDAEDGGEDGEDGEDEDAEEDDQDGGEEDQDGGEEDGEDCEEKDGEDAEDVEGESCANEQ
jgi:hypothetical protein